MLFRGADLQKAVKTDENHGGEEERAKGQVLSAKSDVVVVPQAGVIATPHVWASTFRWVTMLCAHRSNFLQLYLRVVTIIETGFQHHQPSATVT